MREVLSYTMQAKPCLLVVEMDITTKWCAQSGGSPTGPYNVTLSHSRHSLRGSTPVILTPA